MRGTATKEQVICALRFKSYVKGVLDGLMIDAKGDRYLSCSPDRIALLCKSSFEDWNVDVQGTLQLESEVLFLAAVETKTRVAASNIGQFAPLSTSELTRCDVGDETFRKYIPREHIGKLMHQLFFLILGWHCTFMLQRLVFCTLFLSVALQPF